MVPAGYEAKVTVAEEVVEVTVVVAMVTCDHAPSPLYSRRRGKRA